MILLKPAKALTVCMAITIAVTIFSACGSATQSNPSLESTSFIYGIHTQCWDQDVERTLRESAAIGATHSTMSFLWHWIEPAPGVFTWDLFDEIVGWGDRYGIKIIAQLQYNRDANHGHRPPDPADYARFAEKMVERYCNHPGFANIVQIWNEPNTLFWDGTAAEYAALLDTAYAAVKRACPKTVVVGFNIASTPDTQAWVEEALSFSPRFDWFGWHTYGPTSFQSVSPPSWDGDAAIPAIRDWLNDHGYEDKPIFNSERGFSWQFGRYPVATLLPQTYIAHLAAEKGADVRGLTLYTYHRNSYTEGDYSLVGLGRNWHKQPAHCAFKTMASIVPKYTYKEQLTGALDACAPQAYLFQGQEHRTMLALFLPLFTSSTEHHVCTPQLVRIHLGVPATVTLTTWLGEQHALHPDKGWLEVEIDQRIKYLEIETSSGTSLRPLIHFSQAPQPETRPIPVDPEAVAFVSATRKISQTDPMNLMQRCFGLDSWHRRLTACLGSHVVFEALTPDETWALQQECFAAAGEKHSLFERIDTAFQKLESIEGQNECTISTSLSADEEALILGQQDPQIPGPACNDF